MNAKFRFVTCITILTCCMFFSSCSSTSEDPIGIWAPIKKTVNGTYIKGNDFNVPKEGGTYKVYSQNYGSP